MIEEFMSDDDDEYYDDSKQRNSSNLQYYSKAEKRAHHNALERERRYRLKDNYVSLRDCLPELPGTKTSRAQVLTKAAEYILMMRRKNFCQKNDINDLRKQNLALEKEIKLLDGTQAIGNITFDDSDIKEEPETESEDETESSESEDDRTIHHSKRQKTAGCKY